MDGPTRSAIDGDGGLEFFDDAHGSRLLRFVVLWHRLVTCNLQLTAARDKPPTPPLPSSPCRTSPCRRRSGRPLEAALERVGDRWSLLLVEALLDGARRFNELAEALPAIAPNILTDRLRRLERERIIVATPYQQRPPRMSYALAADGRELASALRLLADWGARRSEAAEPLHHEAVRHVARDALVVPDLRRGGRRRAGRPRRARSDSEAVATLGRDGRRALGTRDAGPRPPGGPDAGRRLGSADRCRCRRACRVSRHARCPRSRPRHSRPTTST